MSPKRALVLIIFITLIALGVSLPAGYPLKFSLGNITIDRELEPLGINIQNERFNIVKMPRTVLGLDVAGGARLVYETDLSAIAQSDYQDALDATRNIIEQRVNLFGVTEPVVRTSQVGDSHRIIVELPGIADVSSARALIGQTALLEIRQFPSDMEASVAATLFPSYEVTGETGLTGKDLRKANVTFDQTNGQSVVQLLFTSEGGKLFEEITRNNVGRQLPIFLDGFPITNPRVDQVITGGTAVISGGFTPEQAKYLSIQLNSGALPVPIAVVEEKTVGPTLGKESVGKSVRAGLIGLGIVMVFMCLYYGRLGILASIALTIYGVVTYAIFRIIPITLTLPGIAGFILSIGMAVDSNILIFERIKEELRDGRPWNIAMEAGFGRAWDSIRDANVTTLLTCFILFNPFNWEFLPQFGLARGFAATLALGIIVSLFTGIVVSRNLIRVFMSGKDIRHD